MRMKFEIVDDPSRESYFYPAKIESTTKSVPETTPSPSVDVYLQKLAADVSSKTNNNLQNSKWFRLLSSEERRHLIDNTIETYEIESRPQSDETVVMKPLFLSYAGDGGGVTPKGRTTSRQVILYEIHESKGKKC